MLSGQPVVIARDDVPEMRAMLRQLMAEWNFGVVHADQLSMSGWGLVAAREAAKFGPRPVTVLDEHNAIYLLARRMSEREPRVARRLVMRREARAFRKFEADMIKAYDRVLVVTAEDARALETLAPGMSFPVIPICVDPDQVAPVEYAAGGPPTILHMGTMFWPPNVEGVLWFAREVFPLVRQAAPAARFVIVGKNPPPEVQALAADPHIEVTGYVNDPTPYLAAASAFVVPLHAGGGMRVKIVDGWMWGMPMVSTPVGAEGIAHRDGENILIAGDATAFACATIELLTNASLNGRLRTAGRSWVEEHYGWRTVYAQVDAVYDELAHRAGLN
jgi:glycosyltransferase involved in cell wall biosynthesis